MLRDWSPFHDLAKAFAEGPVCLRVVGLTGGARALAVAELLQGASRPGLVLVPSVLDAHRWTQDLKFFGAAALEFPEGEPRLWRGGRQREADAERALACQRLAAGETLVVAATPPGLDAEVLVPAAFAARALRLEVGDALDRELLVEAFEHGGYERVDTVVEVGQWSARGGIVDVFSPTHPNPARVEFFGDEIESIRLFDPTSQRSTGALEELVALPVEPSAAREARLLTYFPVTAPVIVDAPRLLDEPVAESEPTLAAAIDRRQRVELSLVTGAARPRDGELVLDAHAVTGYAGKLAHVCAEIERWRQEGFRVRLVAADPRQGDQLHDIL